MESLHAYFDALDGRQCITVIGSGGKTSLIQHLAQNRRRLKTLVTTTTKMALPTQETGRYDYFRSYSGQDQTFPPPSQGITLAGIPDTEAGKLVSLPLDILAEAVPCFDYTLIEGDGSRTLPLKAWADYEPVVPPYTTATVGILPLWTLGMAVSETIIHRLPLFTALTQAEKGETLTLRHLASVITSSPPEQGKGLFSAAQGKQILFFNQIENDTALAHARELVSLLPSKFLSSLYGIIAGSVHQDQGIVLWS